MRQHSHLFSTFLILFAKVQNRSDSCHRPDLWFSRAKMKVKKKFITQEPRRSQHILPSILSHYVPFTTLCNIHYKLRKGENQGPKQLNGLTVMGLPDELVPKHVSFARPVALCGAVEQRTILLPCGFWFQGYTERKLHSLCLQPFSQLYYLKQGEFTLTLLSPLSKCGHPPHPPEDRESCCHTAGSMSKQFNYGP